jgi:hypothetical protein
MKARPDTDAFGLKKDLSAFLGGAATDAPARPSLARVHREQKIFRLPVDLIADLKRTAYERSAATGARVTETDLVEQALRRYL